MRNSHLVGVILLFGAGVHGGEPAAGKSVPDAERGRKALLGRSFTPPMFSRNAYANA